MKISTFSDIETSIVFKNKKIERNAITRNEKFEQISDEATQKHIKIFFLIVLAILQVEKTFYAFVKSSIQLITKFKTLRFIKHALFFLFSHSTKFFKYTNNCFTFNFLTFLFNSHYQKLLIKLIKIS